jgi:hypothetical protein
LTSDKVIKKVPTKKQKEVDEEIKEALMDCQKPYDLIREWMVCGIK